jgi:hypothetical protein
MKEYVINAVCVAKQSGIYTKYVFKNIDTEEYVMCTLLPNWDISDIKTHEKGFLRYQFVKAGEEYYNRKIDEKIKFKFTDLFLISFIKNNNEFKQDEITL